MSYDNTNRGTLGKNERREKDSHPEYAGTLNVDGKDYWLSGWVKESAKGKFFSLSVKPKEARGEKPAPSKPADDFDDSEIPF
jgi:hypothetical protein